MKYLFYLGILAFIYRAFMQPKVIVEHRHFHEKKPKNDKRIDSELTDYEEIK
jgi:hypothetical protein